MNKPDDDRNLPYLARGNRPVATDSSVLVSSSKFLNNAPLRDWIATHYLRRNGPDRAVPADNIPLFAALDQVISKDEIEELFIAERRHNTALDQWLAEGTLSAYTKDDFRDYAPGTVGGIFYKFLVDNNAEIEFLPRAKPKTCLEYFQLRHFETHDFEHILTGAQFTLLGEITPYWVNIANIFKFVGPELAGQLCVKYLLASLRYMTRAMLHYPETWVTAQRCLELGITVGQASECIFMFKYDNVFHLTPEEARRKLGVRGVFEVDSEEASRVWSGAPTANAATREP